MKNTLEGSLAGLIISQVKNYWIYYSLAFICLIFTHFIQAQIPFWAKDLADSFENSLLQDIPWHFVIAAVGIIFFRTFSRFLFFNPARFLQKKLRLELLTLLESVSPFRFRQYSKGQLFQLLGSDIDQIRALIGFAFLQTSNIIIACLILIPQLASIHPRLIFTLSPMLLALIIFTIVISKNKILYKKMQSLQGDIQNFIIESYLGKETINTFHSEKIFIENFKKISSQELWNFYKAGNGISLVMPLIPLGIGMSLIWGAHMIHSLELGKTTLISFSGFIFLFTSPLMFMVWIGTVVSRSVSSWERLKELVFTLSQKSDFESWASILDDKDPSHFWVNLWDQKSEIIFEDECWSVVVGKTGSGKSTFLLQVAEMAKFKNLEISYVAQDPYIYNDILVSNIFLGKDWSSEDWSQAYSFLKIFQLDGLARNQENLKNLEVGEHGKLLSGGQSKRLNLVKSLMSGADILIWDDPFSSIDVLMEKKIVDELIHLNIFKNKKIIMTSHRLTSVRYAKELIFLEEKNGIVEKGLVAELLKKESSSRTYEYFKDQYL